MPGAVPRAEDASQNDCKFHQGLCLMLYSTVPSIVEELALQSIISSREGNGMTHSSPLTEEPENILVQVDNESSINQTELQLSTRNHAQEEEEEEEEEEESDS
ncbi:snRNA-activating protein complex subunit 5 isoform X1 [Gracilinanus agilis]|uniref:snRNA-activating protein complex subunit 5 isoform X1 n=1 Tax=Gracilinanus agilis TaxID=191870 RepID=UPI001CFEC8EF|nr:snRNA-activating protein complex subunit 5 isoform X1 [Gracilinanus agilis]